LNLGGQNSKMMLAKQRIKKTLRKKESLKKRRIRSSPVESHSDHSRNYPIFRGEG